MQHASVTPGNKRLRSGSSTTTDDASTSDSKVEEWFKKRKPSPSQSHSQTQAAAVRHASLERLYSNQQSEATTMLSIYDRKALVARISMALTSPERGEKLSLSGEINKMKKIKFFTQTENEEDEPKMEEFEVVYDRSTTKLAFEEHLTKHANIKFPKSTELPAEYLAMCQEVREIFNYFEMQYTTKLGWAKCRRMDEKSFRQTYSRSARIIACTSSIALCADMRNGEGKRFIQDLCQEVKDCLHIREMSAFIPGSYDGCNSQIELLADGDVFNFHRPYTEPMMETYFGHDPEEDGSIKAHQIHDLLPYPYKTAKVEIPDYIIASRVEDPEQNDIFLLIVEIKPVDTSFEGLFQCCKQVISKLHLQKFVIGLMITPARYFFLLAYKDGNDIFLSHYNEDFEKNMADKNKKSFHVDNFLDLLNMLARVILYAKHLSCGKVKL